MQQVEIHSKRGSLALGVAGVVDVLCALATLLIYVDMSWGAIGTLDLLLQLMLVGSAVAGLVLCAIALESLGVLHLRHRSGIRHALPARRNVSEASS